MIERRLLIRPGAVGDCLLCLPALEHVRASYTEIWIPSAVVPLVRFADAVVPISATGIDLVGVGDLEIPRTLIEKLRSFDAIVSWYGSNRPEFREALQRLGLECDFHAALPPADYRGHAIDFFSRQVGAPLGLQPRIATRGSARRETIVIHPFSGSARKNWALERYRELANRLPYPVDWTAGPEERLPGATRFDNLVELADWIAGARLYIGNDSGMTHLAAATGQQTLALFGPASPEIWAPRGERVCVARAHTLEQLAVEDVLSAANRLLD